MGDGDLVRVYRGQNTKVAQGGQNIVMGINGGGGGGGGRCLFSLTESPVEPIQGKVLSVEILLL